MSWADPHWSQLYPPTIGGYNPPVPPDAPAGDMDDPTLDRSIPDYTDLLAAAARQNQTLDLSELA